MHGRVNNNTLFNHIYFEGFWYDEDDSDNKHFPFPKATHIQINQEFIKRVKLLIERCFTAMYCGYSACRLCGYETNGCLDCAIRGDGQTFIFPDGLLHYYKVHHVLPSYEFYTFVMRIDPIFFKHRNIRIIPSYVLPFCNGSNVSPRYDFY